MITVLIIEDEENARILTRQYLGKLEEDIYILGEAGSVKEGTELIRELKPDLVLLDVRLSDGTGFDILEAIGQIDFKVIFMTAYEEYALDAFKHSAVDYLLKPFSIEELAKAIDKVTHIIRAEYTLQLHTLIEKQHSAIHQKRLIISSIDKIHVVKINDIYRCESDQSYCHFYLQDGSRITVSKPLKQFEEMLESYQFFRVHKSHLINLEHVKRFERTDGGFIVMKDESRVPVSFRKREVLLKTIENL